MTDRAQPGAIDSLIRNDELAQIFGRSFDGFIVPASDPTPAAQRRSDIDETALDAFSLTTSFSSLDVTVAPGEAFVSGWVCRDVSTTLTLPANSTVDIVVGFNPDAVFDPNVDPDRDAADETIVDIAANVDPTTPTTVVHRIRTGNIGTLSSQRVARIGASKLQFFGPFKLSLASFLQSVDIADGVSLSQPHGIALNPSGTKLFVAGSNEEAVFQYAVPKPFDLSAADVTDSLDVSGQETKPRDIAFNSDGTKMFVIGINSDSVHEYSLPTQFDLNNASFTGTSFSVSSEDARPRDVVFNSDGTKMFIIGNGSDSVHQYSLTTGFDITTASFTGTSFDISGQDSIPASMAFNSDGTKMFIVGSGSDSVHQYSLATGFDISTASFSGTSFDVSGDVGIPSGLTFGQDGANMFVTDLNGPVTRYLVGETIPK